MKTRRRRYRSPEGRENAITRNQAPQNRAHRLPVRQDRAHQASLATNLTEIYENVKSIPSFTSKIKEFLNQNETSSVFKQVRHKFPRRHIVAHYSYQIVMSDTINYRNISGPENKGFKYIMIVIDVFSKVAWAEPMKRLNDISSVEAIESILKRMDEIPKNFVTDRGKEYFNRKTQNLFERYGIKHYSLRGPHKAANAERFIRTLKSRIERYFWKNKTSKWIDILEQFVQNYNKTFHRSIKMAPYDVNENNRELVYERLYPHLHDHFRPRLKLGDRVRILREKNTFTKGYKRSWSLEIYKIGKVFTQGAIDFYQIETLSGDILPRKRYYWELNLIASERNDNSNTQ